MKNFKPRKSFIIIGIIAFSAMSLTGFIISAFVISNYVKRDIANQPQQDKILEALKTEFNTINKLPNSKVVDQHYTAYNHKTSIDISYNTPSSDLEIQKYYTTELEGKGWKLIKEEKLKDWGRDLGGRNLTFQKSNFIFSIQLAGDRKGYGWAYALDLRPKQ